MISGSDDATNVENIPGNFQQKQEGCNDGDDDVWADFGHYTEGYGYADSDAESEYTPEEAIEVLRRAAVRCSTAGLCGRGSGGGRSIRGSLEKDSSAVKGVEVEEASSLDGDGGFDGDCRDSAAGVDEEMSPPPVAGVLRDVECGGNGVRWGKKDGE